ncbi:hypothetical protein PHLCEN_2v6027 [Hermanssonia centrifuga]|uniref:Uncharacterized protein n=1 Tax=Hermanssonia centrifuga TaxID=98765 RepID=A0A2R6P0Q1_9APHY|nr:hypothetical protein PHLCEN_2v6027 [Hermanssonia centrifuga]
MSLSVVGRLEHNLRAAEASFETRLWINIREAGKRGETSTTLHAPSNCHR